MKRVWFIAVIVLLLTSCINPQEVKAQLGKEFTLPFGRIVAIAGEDLKIKFTELIEDSRCPKGAVCVWAGRVSCVIEIERGTSAKPTVLTQPGLTDEHGKEVYEDLTLAFSVEPYPEVGKKIETKDYRLFLTVSK